MINPKELPVSMQVLDRLVSALAVTLTCPRCKQVIPSEDVNVPNDIAFCRNCNLTHSLSGLALGVQIDENVDLSRPPAGTSFQREGSGTVIRATHRSFGQALGLLLFCLFWNGIVSVFVSFAIASTLQHLGVTLPHGFPAPTSHGHPVGIGLTLFLWLFLTPFIAIGLGMLAGFFNCLLGRTEIRIQGGQGIVFSGVGPLSFRKRFATSDVTNVRIESQNWRDNSGNAQRKSQIVIDTRNKPVRFGSMLAADRRQFVAAAVRKELVRG